MLPTSKKASIEHLFAEYVSVEELCLLLNSGNGSLNGVSNSLRPVKTFLSLQGPINTRPCQSHFLENK